MPVLRLFELTLVDKGVEGGVFKFEQFVASSTQGGYAFYFADHRGGDAEVCLQGTRIGGINRPGITRHRSHATCCGWGRRCAAASRRHRRCGSGGWSCWRGSHRGGWSDDGLPQPEGFTKLFFAALGESADLQGLVCPGPQSEGDCAWHDLLYLRLKHTPICEHPGLQILGGESRCESICSSKRDQEVQRSFHQNPMLVQA